MNLALCKIGYPISIYILYMPIVSTNSILEIFTSPYHKQVSRWLKYVVYLLMRGNILISHLPFIKGN